MAATILDRPALGAFLQLPEVVLRRRAAHMAAQRSLHDHTARARAMARLVKVHEGLRTGRRYELCADDLRRLADALDRLPTRLHQLDEARDLNALDAVAA